MISANGRRVTVSTASGADFCTIEDAIRSVNAGTTLVLSAETHHLSRPIGFSGDLFFEGGGVEKTLISSYEEGAVLIFAGGGQFEARGLSFLHTGSRAVMASVVVMGGQARLVSCGFSGGVRSEAGDEIGAGLAIGGEARATVEGCYFINNQGPGVHISESGVAVIRNCQCHNNGLGGVYLETPSATETAIEGTSCTENDFAGVFVAGGASPTVQGNTCRQNKGPGIVFADRSAGTASNNLCEANTSYGIMVMGQAMPSLVANTCTANEKGGIGYERQGGGVARQNLCNNNSSGIYVGGQARPLLEGNVCQQNRQAGIGYIGSGAGVARGNQCGDNGNWGIYIERSARPKLEGNSCEQNGIKAIDDRRSWLSRLF